MLGSEAQTIIAKAYVERRHNPDLSKLPTWISPEETAEYVEQLRNDPREYGKREIDRVMQQDSRSRRETL